MLRIQRGEKSLVRLGQPQLAEVEMTERNDLQEFIFNSPENFFGEIGLSLFVLAKELRPSEVVQDRIDLLCVDEEGRIVIIELKRGNHKLQLLQAVAYAGMIAKWRPEDFLKLIDAKRRSEFDDFIGMERDAINREQRIILIAEAYDFEVLVAAEWLHETYGVDILCCRVSLAVDQATKAEFLSCSTVFPAPELARLAVPRRRAAGTEISWNSWQAALEPITNPAVVKFFEKEIALNRESNLPKRFLAYRIEGKGKRRYYVSAKMDKAYCWQAGRFERDAEFWRSRLSQSESIVPVDDGLALRFYVVTEQDFTAFQKAIGEELLAEIWDPQPTSAELDSEQSAATAAAGHP